MRDCLHRTDDQVTHVQDDNYVKGKRKGSKRQQNIPSNTKWSQYRFGHIRSYFVAWDCSLNIRFDMQVNGKINEVDQEQEQKSH